MSDSKLPLLSQATAAIIVAAGRGLRAGQPVPKQFAPWRGKAVVRHSAEVFAAAGVTPIVVAIPENAKDVAGEALSGIPGIRLITGGDTRQRSVRLALDALADVAPNHVLIHDAARPVVPHAIIERLLTALETHAAAIPVLPVVDSLTQTKGGQMGAPARREELRRVQTPQAFHFADILRAHHNWSGDLVAGDDAQVAQADGISIHLVEGDEDLRKLTYSADFARDAPNMRVGIGYDVHRLVAGEELWLCGIKLEHEMGLAGHSDADVAIHALVDAILGAIGEGDIGQHFPPSEPQWKDASSDHFLSHAIKLAAGKGYRIGNVDVTIICETPKIGPYRTAMRDRLTSLLDTDSDAVNIKATTTERLGYTGRGEGIAAQAIAMLIRP